MVINSGEDICPTLALKLYILALLKYWVRRNLFYWTWARMIISLTLSGTYPATTRRVDIRVELRFRITEQKNEKKLGVWRHDWEGGDMTEKVDPSIMKLLFLETELFLRTNMSWLVIPNEVVFYFICTKEHLSINRTCLPNGHKSFGDRIAQWRSQGWEYTAHFASWMSLCSFLDILKQGWEDTVGDIK